MLFIQQQKRKRREYERERNVLKKLLKVIQELYNIGKACNSKPVLIIQNRKFSIEEF